MRLKHRRELEVPTTHSPKHAVTTDLPFTGYISRHYIETIKEYQKQHLIRRYIEGKIFNGKMEGIWLTFSEEGNFLFKTFL